ncbi:argininosuccinate lyase [Chloroflexota bacterium]
MSFIRGRFNKEADESVIAYTSSLPYDWRLYQHDITGSIAHIKMLAKQNIITSSDADVITRGLLSIQDEMKQGQFQFNPEQEDIHMSIEARLLENIGEVGGKLHTARSRNDQIALDLRLFTKEAIANIIQKTRTFQEILIDLAETNKNVVMPGYTHLQPAQPVLMAHHILAYFEMMERDVSRFNACLERADVMPLGSGALAGVAYNVDREFLAHEMGFSKISRNSMDAVSDRDFVVEFQAAASLCMMHLSRLAEEIILWSSAQFGFVELDEAYATGSSIMPQKKNPDVAELARGKTGRVYGKLMAILTVMKGLPLSYNRDLQEDKEGLFDTVDTLIATLGVFSGMVSTLKINEENTAEAVVHGYILATDLAGYLVKKGESFRNAHSTVGKLVTYAAEKDKTLGELTQAEYRNFSPLFDEDVYSITVESSLASRDIPGGTAPNQVKQALEAAKKLIKG